MADSAQLLRESWRKAVAAGDAFPLLFYAVLFDMAPTVAELFPPDMREQRRHLVATLGHVVAAASPDASPESAAAVRDRLLQLGRDHRRFGAEPEHYPVVGAALLLTLSHFVQGWTDEHEQGWSEAFTTVAAVMAEGAENVGDAPPTLDLKVEDNLSTLDLADLLVTAPSTWPRGFGPGADVWAHRVGRASGWTIARTVLDDADRVHVLAPIIDDDLDAVALSLTPPGSVVRLAPAFDQEASPNA